MTEGLVRDRVAAVLDGVDGLVSAYLFGSVASGRAHRDSDVDLAVLLDRDVHPTAGLVDRNVGRDHAHLRLTLSRAADLEPFLRRTRMVKLRALAP